MTGLTNCAATQPTSGGGVVFSVGGSPNTLSVRCAHQALLLCSVNIEALAFLCRGDPSCRPQRAAVAPCTSAVVVVLMRYFPSLTLPPTGPFVYDRLCVLHVCARVSVVCTRVFSKKTFAYASDVG